MILKKEQAQNKVKHTKGPQSETIGYTINGKLYKKRKSKVTIA